jgi:hypothetical protein
VTLQSTLAMEHLTWMGADTYWIDELAILLDYSENHLKLALHRFKVFYT